MRHRLHASLVAVTLLGLMASPVLAAGLGQGVYFPGQSVANPDGALSLSVNPAGLAEPHGFDLRLQYDTGSSLDAGARTDWGGFLSVPLGPLALAGSVEHANAGAEPWYARTQAMFGVAMALGDRAFLGTSSRSQTTPTGNLHTWDFGILLRPLPYLSLGGRVTGLASDTVVGSIQPVTHWAYGVALRPFGSDRLTLAGDVDWPDGKWDRATQTATLSSRFAHGLTALAEFRRAFLSQDVEEQRLSLMLRVGFGKTGVDVGGHTDRNAGATFGTPGLSVGLRASGDTQTSVLEPGPATVRIDLHGDLSEHDDGHGVHLATLIQTLRRLERMQGTKTVLFHVQGFGLDWAQVEELRAAMARLRAVGKRVVWFAEDLGTRGLAVAAACDRIVVPPAGTVSARGIGGDFVSLHETLARVGITVEAVKFGAHKTAPEALIQDAPSDALTAQLKHSIERQWQTFVQDVALGRDITPAAVEAALEQGVVFPEDALAAKLIDAVVQPSELEGQLRLWNLLGAGESMQTWHEPAHRRQRWGQQPRIAVVEVDGTITDHGGMSIGGQSLSGVDVAKAIQDAGRDSGTKAVIARIRSPGGSVYGSDAMADALRKASDRKPVLASMGGVAASGGYWTSLGAPLVFADRATVTGSIGIFVLKPSLAGLFDKLGLHLTHFGQGPHDDATSLSRPWSAADHAAVQRTLSRYYGLFLDRTAHARKLDRAGLTDLAEGRIWYGDEAKDRGLIDRIGGMREAVDEAASRAHLDLDDDEVKFDYLPHPALFERIKSSLGLSVEAVAGQQAWLRALQTAAGPWLDAAAMAQLAQEPGPLAVLPAHAAVPGP